MSCEAKFDIRRSWYSQTFSDDDEETHSPRKGDELLPSDACNVVARPDDVGSDVSTDVGEEEDYRSEHQNELPGFEADFESSLARHVQLCHERPRFCKASRQQKIDQSKRVADEFAMLDFDSVDASSQEGLVMRKLVLLKSLKDCTTYYSGAIRRQETRLSLLGLHKDENVLDEIACRAQTLCDSRAFRSAYNVLQEAIASVFGRTRDETTSEDIEAMKLRRLQKRQHQREERRVQRRQDRKERFTQRCKDGV